MCVSRTVFAGGKPAAALERPRFSFPPFSFRVKRERGPRWKRIGRCIGLSVDPLIGTGDQCLVVTAVIYCIEASHSALDPPGRSPDSTPHGTATTPSRLTPCRDRLYERGEDCLRTC